MNAASSMITRPRAGKGRFWFSRTSARTAAGGVGAFDRAAAWLTLLAAALGIFAVSPYASDVHQFPKYAGFTLSIGFAVLLWLLARVRAGAIAGTGFPGAQALAAGAVVATLVTLAADDRRTAVFGDPSRVGPSLVLLLSGSAFLFLACQYLRDVRTLRTLRAALAAGGAVVFLVFLVRAFLPLPAFFGRMGLSPLSITLSETAVFAAAMAGLALAVLAGGQVSRAATALWTLSGALALTNVVLIGTPRAWFALGVGTALVLLASVVREGKRRGLWPSVALALLVASVPGAFFGTPSFARLALPVEFSLSADESLLLARTALGHGAKEFLLGVGFGGYARTFAVLRPSALNAGPTAAATSLLPAGSHFLLLIEGGVLLFAAMAAFVLALLRSLVAVWGVREGGLRARVKDIIAPGGARFTDLWPLVVALVAVRAGSFAVSPSFGTIAVTVTLLALFLAGQAMLLGEGRRWTLAPFERLRPMPRTLVGGALVVLVAAHLALFARVTAAEAAFGAAIRAFAAKDFARAAELSHSAVRWNGADARYPLGEAQSTIESAIAAGAPEERKAEAAAMLRTLATLPSRDVEYWLALLAASRRFRSVSADAAETSLVAAERAVALAPGIPGVRLAAGDAAAEAGKGAVAAQRYAEAIAQKPDFVGAYLRWASLALTERNDDLARVLSLQAIRAAPGNTDALTFFINLSLSRQAPGDDEAAASALLALLAVRPDDRDALALLGSVLERLGRPAEARTAYVRLRGIVGADVTLDRKIADLDARIAAGTASSTPASETAPDSGNR